jgi:hypothetical protein
MNICHVIIRLALLNTRLHVIGEHGRMLLSFSLILIHTHHHVASLHDEQDFGELIIRLVFKAPPPNSAARRQACVIYVIYH